MVESEPRPRPRQVYPALTGVRIVAALLVVAYHFGQVAVSAAPEAVRNLVKNGHMGVSFFFVLSGFVLAHNHLGCADASRRSAPEFWAARIGRVYPLYVLGWLLTLPEVVFTRLRSHDDLAHSAVKLVVSGGINLGCLQAWLPSAGLSWNFPSWSVSVEAAFYLSFPLLGARLMKARSARRWGGLVLLTALTAVARLALRSVPLLDGHLSRLPPLFLLQFAIGIVFSLEAHALAFTQRSHWRAAILLAAATMITLPPSTYSTVEDCGGAAWMFGLVIAALRTPGPILRRALASPVAVTIGDASYCVYIIQAPVWSAFNHLGWGAGAGAVTAYVAVLLSLSVLVSETVDARLRPWFVATAIRWLPRVPAASDWRVGAPSA